MKIPNFVPYIGQHCETTATGGLLKQIGIELSEPMLFGIGEGLGFVYWKMKTMDFPFMGGRIKADKITENICKNLNLILDKKETSSLNKAWQNVEKSLSENIAVGLKMDCFYLDYFANKFHFAGHYATIYGFDEIYAYLNDTQQQGVDAKTTLVSLEAARAAKGPMSSKNLSYTIKQIDELPDLNLVIKKAIFNNANDYLAPPIKNIGYKGIKKSATEIQNWFEGSKNREFEFTSAAILMERAGTGGALFRNLYRDFLAEAYERTSEKLILEAHNDFKIIAQNWTTVSEIFAKIGSTGDQRHVNEASALLIEIAGMEKQVMEKLQSVYI